MDLPEPVRSRLVSLVAASLGDLAPLPPALRHVAGFAPGRRARLGAGAIVSELDRDEELRRRVALQLRARTTPEPTDAAVVAWLERPEGWEETLRAAAGPPSPRSGGPGAAREDRLRQRAEEAERALREQRRAHKESVEELKGEIARLRRLVGETRAKERTARDEAEAGRVQAEEAAARLEREVRHLRAELTRHEDRAGERRRRTREEREEVTVRARLLLETLTEAAAGLRRELALPPASGRPGERVEASFAASPEQQSRPAAPDPASPGLLEQYLALPQARLIVDGYNVTKSAWPTLSLEAQRGRLLALLPGLVARTGAETTVVFDAAASGPRPVVGSPRRVKVLFSPVGVIADDVIRELVAAEPTGRVVVVVTDDRALGDDLRRGGARVVSPAALLGS